MRHERIEYGGGQRRREQVTLAVIATCGGEQVALGAGFHPFGDHLHVAAAGAQADGLGQSAMNASKAAAGRAGENKEEERLA